MLCQAKGQMGASRYATPNWFGDSRIHFWWVIAAFSNCLDKGNAYRESGSEYFPCNNIRIFLKEINLKIEKTIKVQTVCRIKRGLELRETCKKTANSFFLNILLFYFLPTFLIFKKLYFTFHFFYSISFLWYFNTILVKKQVENKFENVASMSTTAVVSRKICVLTSAFSTASTRWFPTTTFLKMTEVFVAEEELVLVAKHICCIKCIYNLWLSVMLNYPLYLCKYCKPSIAYDVLENPRKSLKTASV